MIKFRIIDEINPNKEYSIPLNFNDVDEWYDWVDEHGDEYDEFVEDLETTYGVLDFDGEPDIVGYTSYEIEDYSTLMQEWFDFWNKHHKTIVKTTFRS